MKEDKLIDSLFQAAKKEAPKTSFKMVALKFTSTVGAGGWLMGAKAAFLNNVYLNSLISILTVGAISTVAYVVLDDSKESTTENRAKEVSYTKWFDHTIEQVERLTYAPNIATELENGKELNTTSLALGTGLNTSTYNKGEEKGRYREFVEINPLKNISLKAVQISYDWKDIEYLEIEKLEVLEKYYKEVLRKDQSTEFYADLDKFSGKELLDNLVANLEMNGISATIEAKYNSADGSIKRLKMDLSDNEGYVQRIICIGFDIMEMHWKSDSNGYPHNLQISWDNGELIDVDLTDQRAPIYKYIDRN